MLFWTRANFFVVVNFDNCFRFEINGIFFSTRETFQRNFLKKASTKACIDIKMGQQKSTHFQVDAWHSRPLPSVPLLALGKFQKFQTLLWIRVQFRQKILVQPDWYLSWQANVQPQLCMLKNPQLSDSCIKNISCCGDFFKERPGLIENALQ